MYTRSSVTIHFPTQFHLACILYQIPPTQFIQDLISNIIIPSDHIHPNRQFLLATDYFLEYAAIKTSHTNPYTPQQKDFLDQKRALYERLLISSKDCTRQEREEVLKLFFEEWLRAWKQLG